MTKPMTGAQAGLKGTGLKLRPRPLPKPVRMVNRPSLRANKVEWSKNKGAKPVPQYGWKTQVVPAPVVKELILKAAPQFQPQPEHLAFKGIEDQGWRIVLGTEISRKIPGSTPESVVRLINRIVNEQQVVCFVNLVDALALATGNMLDSDVIVPILPGSLEQAEEMIALRDPSLSKAEVKKKGRDLFRLCRLIIAYPHNMDRLLALAPYNCLLTPPPEEA